jgi:hypothetical protein
MTKTRATAVFLLACASLCVGGVGLLWAGPASDPNGPIDTDWRNRLQADFVLTKLEVIPSTGSKLIAGRKARIDATFTRTGPIPIAHVWMRVIVDGVVYDNVVFDETCDPDAAWSTLSIPWTPSFGPHTISARVDSTDVVTESNEANNSAATVVLAQLAGGVTGP